MIKLTPSKLMFGFEQRNHTDYSLAQFIKAFANVDSDLEREREISRDTAILDLLRNYNKMYRDSHCKKPNIYKEGDYVLVKDNRNKIGINTKLKPKYKGPYQIIKSLGNNRYVVKDIPGFNITQKPLHTIFSSDKIKPWVKHDVPAKEYIK